MIPSFNAGLPVETLEPRTRESPFRRPVPAVARRTRAFDAAAFGCTLATVRERGVPPVTAEPAAAPMTTVEAMAKPRSASKAPIVPWPWMPPQPTPARVARPSRIRAVFASRTMHTEPTGRELEALRQAEAVIDAVCLVWPVARSHLEGHRRCADLARPRQCAMALMRMCDPQLSMPLVGALLGGRDHTTVMHAERRHAELMAALPAYAERVDAVQHYIATGEVRPPPPTPAMMRRLARLRVDPDEVLRLRSEGKTYQQIGAALGCHHAVAWRIVSRARIAA